MKTEISDQYGCPCIVIDDDDMTQMGLDKNGADRIIEEAREEHATFEDEPGSICYVIQFPNRPMELYTESALRRSFPKVES